MNANKNLMKLTHENRVIFAKRVYNITFFHKKLCILNGIVVQLINCHGCFFTNLTSCMTYVNNVNGHKNSDSILNVEMTVLLLFLSMFYASKWSSTKNSKTGVNKPQKI